MSGDFLKDRRRLLKTLGFLGTGLLTWPVIKSLFSNKSNPSIHLSGIPTNIAHQIHKPTHFPSPLDTKEQPIVIIGSGIAGLTAARHLYRHGYQDFSLLELENTLGGNAASSQNAVSTFPIAAHYLPILSNESDFLIDFLKEENIITGFNEKGEPYYNEMYLCHDLKERLYLNGTWQEGLVPSHGITSKDEYEFERFFDLMQTYQQAIDKDGKHAFCIPIAVSSNDPTYRRLDKITMADFLKQNHFDSPYLLWYVNYCCRDDYGAGIEAVSAWAGIHYFASRRTRAANAGEDAILTWPEGNSFLANRLAKDYLTQIKTQSQVYSVSPLDKQYLVKYFDLTTQTSYAILADSVIMAVPRFIAHQICKPHFQSCFAHLDKWVYSPWLVANITLDNYLSDYAWDNVSFYSNALGYIDAAHQALNTQIKQRVVTYYQPLDDRDPHQARFDALSRDLKSWQKMIMADLEHMHADISKHITDIEVRLFGHAMIRPIPEQIWSSYNLSVKRSDNNGLFFAHSDMSGISIFEEAFWQGLQTGKAAVLFLNSRKT